MNIQLQLVSQSDLYDTRIREGPTEQVYIDQMSRSAIESEIQIFAGSQKTCVFLSGFFHLQTIDIQTMRYSSFLVYESEESLIVSAVTDTATGYVDAIHAIVVEITFLPE